jgi:hypothetical protein
MTGEFNEIKSEFGPCSMAKSLRMIRAGNWFGKAGGEDRDRQD